MPEIVCPHHHTAFQVDESGYAHSLCQVRDKETALELARAEFAQNIIDP